LEQRECGGNVWASSPEVLAARVMRGVVAITFTEKAAAQMGQEVARGLESMSRGTLPLGVRPSDIQEHREQLVIRASALLASMDLLKTSTIHAFCRAMLARHPFEAGVHPNFQVDADHSVIADLAEEVLERHALRALSLGEEHPLFLLFIQGFTSEELVEALIRIAKTDMSAHELGADPFGPQALHAMLTPVQEALGEFIELHADRFGDHRHLVVSRRLMGFLDDLRLCLKSGAVEVSTLETMAQILTDRFDENKKRMKDWSDGKFNREETRVIGEDLDRYQGFASFLRQRFTVFKDCNPAISRLICAALAPVLAELREAMRRQGVLGFAQLLSGASRLLQDHPGTVAKAERRLIDQLLVDEFQDTDPTQCALVRWLALEGPSSERPGLFLVGDPKQSIYGWRSADLGTYTDFVNRALQRDGAVEQKLTTNYRSCVAILDWVNRVFERVMVEEPGLQPGYLPLVHPSAVTPGTGRPSVDWSGTRWSSVESWVTWDWASSEESIRSKLTSAQAAQLEAQALVDDLIQLREAGHLDRWDEAMILFRKMTDVEIYLRAFRRAQIPYAVERDKNYYRRREVIEATALIRCILDPGDHLALLTVLRSAWVGVPDAALIPLWCASFPGLITLIECPDDLVDGQLEAAMERASSSTPQDVPGLDRVPGWAHSLRRFIHNLAAARLSAQQDVSDVFVRTIRERFLLEVVESARFMGDFRVANLDGFFRNLEEDLRSHPGEYHRVLRRMRKRVQIEQDAEERKPIHHRDDAVQVMTIHKSKGLKARHVYLVQTQKGRMATDRGKNRGDRTQVVRRDGLLRERLMGLPGATWAEEAAHEQEVSDAENIRSLYVAMTRAQDRLVLMGRWKGPEKGSKAVSETSHLYSLEQLLGADVDLAEAMVRCARSGDFWTDDGGIRWVFPVLDPNRGKKWAQADRSIPTLALSAVERGLSRLAARRERAMAHQARPLGMAITSYARMSSGHPGFAPEKVGNVGAAPRTQEPEIATAVGTAVHDALEHLDLDASHVEQVTQALDRVRFSLEHQATRAAWTDEVRERALAEGGQRIQEVCAGPFLGHLVALRDQILGRELPVILKANPADEGPTSHLNGSLDLVYKDPETGRLVVVDYKTDLLAPDAVHGEPSPSYLIQGRSYQQALKSALGLALTPHFALWYLRTGHIVHCDHDGETRWEILP
jgi:ATP-dependent exoDNAse (exonuclease V) beta subunit